MELQIMKNKNTINSREVAEMVNKQHSHVMRDVKNYVANMIELGQSKSGQSEYFINSTYINEQNKEQPCYELTRKGCEFYANKMTGIKGTEFTMKYIDRFHEMEQQFKLPTTYKEALLQLVEQVEQNEQLQLTNKVQEQRINELQPKATYYDLVLQNKSTLTVNQIAKDYGMSAIKLNKLLNELGIQYKQGKIWLLYAKHQDKGYTQSHTWVDDTDTSRISTRWTQKGRLFIYELLKAEGVLPMIEREVAS